MKFHRRLPAAALALLACAALAAPAAADPPAANYPRSPWAHTVSDTPAAPVPPVGDTPADYPGMPGASADREFVASGPAHAPQAGGFDWPSAAIGAAGAGLLIVLSLGGVSVLSHRRVAR
jgi:hypothetical protein